MSPHDAAVVGTNAIARPVITGALTTVISMSPLLLLSGTESKYMWVLPATVVFVVIGSLFECMLLLPSHIAESFKTKIANKKESGWFKQVEKRYRTILQNYLQHPLLSITTLSLVTIAAFFIVSKYSNFEPYPDIDSDSINVIAELPTGVSLDETYQALNEVERRIKQTELAHFIKYSYVSAGNHDIGEMDYLIEGQQKNWGKVVIQLTSFNDRSITAQEIARVYKEAVADMSQFSRLEVLAKADNPPSGKPVELQVILDSEEREKVADALLGYLQQHPGVSSSWSNYSPGRSLIELKLNYEAMARYGIKTANITRTLRVAYDGILVEELQTREELIRFRLQLQDKYRRDINALRSLTVISPNGDAIPLRNMADFEMKQGRSSIFHFAGLRAETIFAELNRDQITPQQINDELRAYIDQQQFHQQYPGIRFRFGGELESQEETAKNMSGGLLLVVATIFFLMVLLFNSLSLPLAALMLIPISFLTVIIIFQIHGLTLGVAATVGLLGLIGVLMNDALVMIDHIRQLHLKRKTNDTILVIVDIIDGAVERLRPLLITAITTLVGLGPAAYGIAGTHPTTEPLLLVMFWGVAVGALVTLFTLPLYLAVDSHIKIWIATRRHPHS